MEIGLIGLGKMGWNLMQNMLDNGIGVVATDIDKDVLDAAGKTSARVANNIKELVSYLSNGCKIVWVMVPAGLPVKKTIVELKELLSDDDIVIDGGNSYYKDSLENYSNLKEKNIHFFDCGTSGGKSGARKNGNFMIGGDQEKFSTIEPIFKKIAAPNGYLYTGAPGSGHYLKMIHNGIEYGMMQAIGEGFEVLEQGRYSYDNESVARVWNNGSVVRGWLMELAEQAFKNDSNLDHIKGVMHSSGEAAWTVQEALDHHVSVPVIGEALMARYRSEKNDTMSGKVVSALRNGFGGHSMDLN
jgi:6-phosphogluconate dehydrogenase